MIAAGTTPEEILGLLGITGPEDLDIEAIAFACRATIVRQPLTGCEANIIGTGEKAIITVNSKSIPGRQRFSAGHELGHWMKDRGKNAFGCTNGQISSAWTGNGAETRANQFASDLLLPLSMFVPLAKGQDINFETVSELAETFMMSRTATAIRLVQHGSFPSMVIHYEQGQRQWFIPSTKDFPSSLFPPNRPQPNSLAGSLIANKGLDSKSDNMRADRWFESNKSSNYYIRESCFRAGPNSVVVILWWEDEQQLIDIEQEEERRANRRSDFREEY